MTDRQRLLAAIKGDPDLVSRLLVVAEPDVSEPVTSPAAAYKACAHLIAGEPVECLAVVALDRRRRVVGSAVLTRGNDWYTIVDPRQIYRWALMQGRSGASAIVIAHNHPSGDPSPSSQDHEVTRRVKAAGETLGIPCLDHIVVGAGRFTSFAEMGVL